MENKIMDSLAVSFASQTPEIVGFEALYNQVNEYLKGYSDLVVIKEKKADAKKDRAFLNSKLAEVRSWKSEKVKMMEAPIVEFKNKVKSLEELFLQTISQIDVQIKKFENEDKERMFALLKERVAFELSNAQMCSSFAQNIKIDDFVLSKTLTGSGELTKYAKDTINQRVLVLQEKLNLRAMRYKEIQVFATENNLLFENLNLYFIDFADGQYQAELEKNKQSWLSIKNSAIQNGTETKSTLQNTQDKIVENRVASLQKTMVEKPIQQSQSQADAKKKKRAVVIFEFDSNKENWEIRKALADKLQEAGFKSVADIVVMDTEDSKVC